MKNFFTDIISTIDISTENNTIPNINPTEIYNEGWMTRLLVYTSIKQGLKINDCLDFTNLTQWSSEGLISSQFVNANKNREGYTHADMTLGDFEIDYSKRGQITVCDNAKIFGIIEAKMGSNLSQGTTHAKDYNQASRNLACISYNTKKSCKTFFSVLAPKSMIKHHSIVKQTDGVEMITQIKNRYTLSDMIIDSDLIDRCNNCEIIVYSYEEWIELIDSPDKEYVQRFYDNCKKWNKIK
ncbi:hypothetical protein ACXR6G_17320 [Ancylomarina sp. YFZ004]